MNDYDTLLVEHDPQGIVICTFNRPEVHNALNLQMVYEIRSLLDEMKDQDNARVLIFTGAGNKAFLSGADIQELRDRKREDALWQINSKLFREIEQFPLPTIAAIQGYALGGGCELAMACDLRICGESSKFGQPEVGLGIIPGGGATYRLPKLVGLGRAKELILTGRIIDAQEASAMGLVNRMVPDRDILDTAKKLAMAIVANSPLAVRFAKMALNAETSTDTGLILESAMQAVLFEDEEKYRRMTAFLEKKKK